MSCRLRWTWRSLLALLLIATLAGCQNMAEPQANPRLLIGPAASHYLVVDSVQQASADNLLRAGVRLHNRSALSRDIRFRFEWLDRDGFAIRGLASRWEHLTLRPEVPYSIDRVATSPQAIDYRIHLFDRKTPAAGSPQGRSQ